jgi:hypothetical protein
MPDEERLKKAIESVIIFHEKSGNTELAGRIRKWYESGYIMRGNRSSLNAIGLDMNEDDPYYWSPTGTIYIPESRIFAAVRPTGKLDFAAIADLAGSLAHEMVHANDEGMLSRAFLTSKAEREMAAYTKTLQSYFAGAFKRNADVQKKQGGPCDKAGDAAEVNKIIGEFNRYYDAEIASKDTARQAPMEKDLKNKLVELQQAEKVFRDQLENNIGYQSLKRERDAIYDEVKSITVSRNWVTDAAMQPYWDRISENERKTKIFISTNPDLAAYRTQVDAKRNAYNSVNKSFESYMNQDVRFPVGNMRIPRLSYDERNDGPQLKRQRDEAVAEMQRIRSVYSDDAMRRKTELQDLISRIDAQLQTLTVDEAKKELETLRTGMNSIIDACEKEKKDPKQAAAPKEDDLLNCLCVSCGGMLGGYYTKVGDCAGGCTCWGPLSGWCTGIPSGEKIARSCYGSAYGVKNPSDADVQNLLAKARAANTKAAEASIRKALKEKRVDDAVSIGKQAKKQDPSMTTPAFAELSGALKQQGWDAVYQSDYGRAIDRLESAVYFNLADADAARKLAGAKRAKDHQWPQVEAKSKEFYELLYAKKIPSSYKAMLQMQDLQKDMAGGQANPLWKQVMADQNKGMEWYNKFSQASNAEWTRLFKEEEWEKAETHIKGVLAYELFPADEKHYKSALDTTNYMLGQRRTALQYYESAKSNFAKGSPADAKGLGSVATELKNQTVHFKANDPRRAPFMELAATMEKAQRALQAKAYAQVFFNNGDMYYRSYNFESAIGQYAEGLRAIRENGDPSDPLYVKYYRLWEDSVAKDKRFKELYAYAAGLAATEKPLDEGTIQRGIATAEDGLKIRPREMNMEIVLNKLKWKLGELKRQQQAVQAGESRWAEGKALFDAGKHNEALGKFKESLKYRQTEERQKYVQDLEAGLARDRAKKETAERLWGEGKALFDQKRFADALGRFKESLKYHQTPERLKYVQDLETGLARDRAKKETAERLWGEGKGLFDRKRYADALGTFKESLKYHQTPERLKYVQDLERGMADAAKKQTAATAAATTTTVTQAPQPAGCSWSGNWQIVASDKKSSDKAVLTMRQQGNTVTGTYRIDYVVDGKPYSESNKFEGSASGNRVTGKWAYLGDTDMTGLFDFKITADCNSFSGTLKDASETHNLSGKRVSASAVSATKNPPASSPAKNSSPSVSVLLVNKARENVHIAPKGESFGPQNRLAPGQSRSASANVANGFIEFCAGRGGKTIECKKQGVDPSDSGRGYSVIFDESNPYAKLVIKVNLK